VALSDAGGLTLCSSHFATRLLDPARREAILAALRIPPKSVGWRDVDAVLADLPVNDPARIKAAVLGLAQLMAAPRSSCSGWRKAPRNAEPAWLSIVRGYIARNIGGRITLEAAASIAGMSRFHLSRSFSRWTGLTFARHVLGERIARAQTLLADPRRSISDVLAEAGFHSANQFFLNFKKATGETPRRFRERVLIGRGLKKVRILTD
jgi:AraC-like DNA-binding protein